MLHAGREDSIISNQQFRNLQYLVERLLMATYRDLENAAKHKLAFGILESEIGAAPLSLDGVVDYTHEVFMQSDGKQ